MARIFEVKDLEAQRQALAAESEIYRQLMRAEIHNLQLYAATFKKRATKLSTLNTAVLLAWPILRRFTASRKASKFRMFGLGMLAFRGWKMYNRFAPQVKSVMEQIMSAKAARNLKRKAAGIFR